MPDDWNTWDPRYHTAAVHPPTGARILAGIRTPDGRVVDDFTWRRGLRCLGHHTVDGTWAEVTVDCTEDCCGAARLRLRLARLRPGVLVGAADLTGARGHAIVLRIAGIPSDWTFAAHPPASTPDHGGEPDEIVFSASRVRFSCAPAGADPSWDNTPDTVLETAGCRAEAAALLTTGWLGRAGEGYVRSLTWNTVLPADVSRPLTLTSRDFVVKERGGFYGTWALHCWDTFFAGLTATWLDHDYARGIFGQILTQATPQGFLPNRVSDDRGRTEDRSQPPVGAYTVLKAYLSTGLSDATRDRRLLDEAYPVLRRWHDWWPRARRGPHGALAWGSDPTDDPGSATADATKRESGMDDSPLWDGIAYAPGSRTMNIADVGLNALHAADAEALARMADILGDLATAQRLRTERATAARRIDRLFWDQAAGHYRNLRDDGSFDVHLAPSMMYPLLAGVPSTERARRMAGALLRPEMLGGSPPLPSISRSDPGYELRYMRGRVWGPIAFLTVEGLRRYGLRAQAAAITDELLAMFRHEWEEHSHVHENYSSDPGEDIHPFEARSDNLLSWGNLLAYLAMQELADPSPGGWRFAHPGRTAAMTNLRLREGPLSVSASDRLRVTLGSGVLLDAPPGSAVEDYIRTAAGVRATVTGTRELRLGVPKPPGTPVRVTAGERNGSTAGTVTGDGTVAVRLPAADERTVVHVTVP